MGAAENKVQSYAQKKLKAAGFLVRKFQYEGRNAASDLIAIGYITGYIECKQPGEEPTAAQAKEHERMRAKGALVFSVSTLQEVDRVVSILRFRNELFKDYDRMAGLR